jgi:hypothetical protein
VLIATPSPAHPALIDLRRGGNRMEVGIYEQPGVRQAMRWSSVASAAMGRSIGHCSILTVILRYG